jgi:hypothetical protein
MEEIATSIVKAFINSGPVGLLAPWDIWMR